MPSARTSAAWSHRCVERDGRPNPHLTNILSPHQMNDAPPNILYLHSHDTGRYVQPYGHPVPTPNIQHLADQGVLFRHAFCATPTCSTSRACLLTGQYGHNNGMLGLAHRGWSLNDYHQHIVHTLREAGYYSVLIGEQHIAKRPEVIGFDRVEKIETTHVESVAPGRAGDPRPSPAAAVLPLGRLLRDPPRLARPALAARRALLAAARQPSRHAPRRATTWPPTGPARARSTRASARCSRRSTPQGADREHADLPHHRPRARLPRRQGDAVRPRARRDADHARARRLHRRARPRRARLAPRRLPHALRARRRRAARLPAGRLAAAARCAAKPPRCARRSSPR